MSNRQSKTARTMACHRCPDRDASLQDSQGSGYLECELHHAIWASPSALGPLRCTQVHGFTALTTKEAHFARPPPRALQG